MKTNIKPKAKGLKQLYAFGKKRKIDLSLSENPLGCSELVVQKIVQVSKNFNDYPPPNGEQLKLALSAKLNCQKESIFISNGSEAIIQLIPRVFAKPGDQVIIPSLTFPMFQLCCQISGLEIVTTKMTDDLQIDLAKIKALISAETKLIFLCNPNNPTGAIIPKSQLTEFIKKVPKSTIIVIDEANIEFGGKTVLELIQTQPNLIVLRTFSKGFGLASLRLGFAVGNQKLIKKLEEETVPFPTSAISEQLACAALEDEDFLKTTKFFVKKERLRLKKQLTNLGFQVFPSQANNLFVQLPESIPTQAFREFLDKNDISVVSGSSFTGFDDRFFRLSPRSEKTNQNFVGLLKKWFKTL